MQMVKVESLDSEGRGVAHVDGKVLFISNALPGENVSYQILKNKKSYALAEAVEINNSSSLRLKPHCQYFGVCGGCAIQHIQAAAQVAFKQRSLEEALQHIGNTQSENILPAIYGKSWAYRFRARMSVKYVAKKGGVLVGFHERKSPFIVDMKSCQIMPKHVSDLIEPLREVIDLLSIRDKLPQIEWAVGDDLTVMVFRIMASPSHQDEAILRQFIEQHQSDKNPLQLWFQTGKINTLQVFYPPELPQKLSYSLPEFSITMPFHPSEFTQVNPAINELMVSRAISLLKPQANEKIIDFFCGIGNFTLPIARSGAEVLGIEGSELLLKRAKENAQFNHLEHKTSFQVANLFNKDEIDINQWLKYDKWLIDPPRDGAFELVQSIQIDSGPQKIVYVSCKPATLARDAEILQTKGYQLKKVGVMNMFPHTAHVESIGLFEKNNSKH